MFKFFVTLGIILLGFSIGYGIQILVRREILKISIPLPQVRLFLLKLALWLIMPITVVGALWAIQIRDARLITLPFLGVFAILLGGVLAIGISKWLKLEHQQAGSFFTCGSFTNIGTLGGLICYLFLGEAGFALVSIYKLFEEIIYNSIGFPIAKLYSEENLERENLSTKIKRLITDPFILISLLSITFGILLNRSGIKRPEFYQTINSILIPVGAFLLITSIGLAMRIRRMTRYMKECVAISLIKFLIVPGIVTFLAYLLDYGKIGDGLPLKVVLILSSMPVAFYSLVPPSIYYLDLDLANSCWLFTTSLLFFILPILYTLVQLF